MKQLFLFLLVAVALAACSSPVGTLPVTSPSIPTLQVVDTPQQAQAPAIEPTREQSSDLSFPTESFSSDQLGLCFSYPQGYQQIPSGNSIEIAAPDLPGSGVKALFWLEISNAYDRSAETIAAQDMTLAAGADIGRSTIMLGGQPAVVLDGMPGQDLQRTVYAVRQPTLYILAFMPTRSENQAASEQMETLYAAVTGSWAWSACPAAQ
ncbi:MAG: hypothetical protein ACXWNQ_05685 [Anaerolineales bacterium]